MPTRYDNDDDLPTSGSGEREISLGTGTVLAIFLALALVCSLFFGLGYSMGRKSAPVSAVTSSPTPSTALRRSPAVDSPATSGETSGSSVAPPDNQVTQPLEENSPGTRTNPAASPSRASAPAVRDHTSSLAKPSPSAALPAPSPDGLVVGDPGIQTFVQVAAVSRKEDADLLLAALKRRGYTALVRQQSQDKLLHIQVGPFPTKKDAEAMRQHLITDGYNPILK